MEKINIHQQHIYADWSESGSKKQAERYVKYLKNRGR